MVIILSVVLILLWSVACYFWYILGEMKGRREAYKDMLKEVEDLELQFKETNGTKRKPRSKTV